MIECTIIGNVGSTRLVQVRETEVLNVSIASSRKVGNREYTDWISGKIWGERAGKLAPYIQTGAKLMFRGRPQGKGFQRKDGTVSAEIVLHVSEVEFLSPRRTTELPLDIDKKPKRKPK